MTDTRNKNYICSHTNLMENIWRKVKFRLVPRILSDPVQVLRYPCVNARVAWLTAFVTKRNDAQLGPACLHLHHQGTYRENQLFE